MRMKFLNVANSVPRYVSIPCWRCPPLADLCSDLVPKIACQVLEPGLIYRRWLRTPASTLPTRFPAALDIGHDSAYGLANACALVYVAA